MLQKISLFCMMLLCHMRNIWGSNSTRDHLFTDDDTEANDAVVDNHRQHAQTTHPHHSVAFHNVRIEEFWVYMLNISIDTTGLLCPILHCDAMQGTQQQQYTPYFEEAHVLDAWPYSTHRVARNVSWSLDCSCIPAAAAVCARHDHGAAWILHDRERTHVYQQ